MQCIFYNINHMTLPASITWDLRSYHTSLCFSHWLILVSVCSNLSPDQSALVDWPLVIYSCVQCPESADTLLLWHSTEADAFPLPYFPCLLSCIVTSHLLRDSLCIALQTEKIMDLINWSLNAIDTIFSTRSWRYLTIRNHDNRSSADWIRLCPGLSKNSENGNSCPKPHKAARHRRSEWTKRAAVELECGYSPQD